MTFGISVPPLSKKERPRPRGAGFWLRDWGFWLTFLLAVTAAFSRFRFHNAFLSFYDDDFFYYLQIARNLATHGLSTFDGIHLTNGYHPLWLLVITAIYKLAPGKAFFYVLEGLTVLLTLSVYISAKTCLLRYTSAIPFASLAAAAVAFPTLVISRGGMEVTLGIPLVLLFLNYRLRPSFRWSGPQVIVMGFLASLVVLARLDSGILVALIFVEDAFFQRFSLQQWLVRAGEYLVGALAVVVYLVTNQRIFGTMLPVSGQAKEIRFRHFPSMAPLKSILNPHSVSGGLLAFPALVLGIMAAVLLVRGINRREGDPSLYAVASALITFPLAYFAVISLLSDWPLFLWYLYPFVLLIFGSAIALIATASSTGEPVAPRIVKYASLGLVAGATLYVALIAAYRKPSDLYLQSADLAEFATTHPGTYAMGDRSGTPAYLIPYPFVQLEGLTMDKQFLQNIRSEVDLTDLLRRYGVSYYVATNPPLENGCYVVVEPREAGPDSARMHGVLCNQPIAQFERAGIKEDVFDVRGF